MSVEQIIFYVFAALTLASALMVITAKNPIQAALSLVLTFFLSAGIWLLLEAEFLAISLILVYVGAVMVLFLFVVMMLDINIAQLRAGFIRYLPIGLLVAIILAVLLVMAVGPAHFGLAQFVEPARHAADYSNVRELGRVMYTVYVYPFEIAAIILLVAIIAAIALTHRRRPETKRQDPIQQIAVKREDRMRVVDMVSEAQK